MKMTRLGLAVVGCLAGLPATVQAASALWEVHPILVCEQTRLLDCRAVPQAGASEEPACGFEDTGGLTLVVDFPQGRVTYPHADVTPVAAAYAGDPGADGRRVDTIVVLEGGGQVSLTRFYGPYLPGTPIVALNTLTFSDHGGTDYTTLTAELRCAPVSDPLSSHGTHPVPGAPAVVADAGPGAG